MTALRRFVKKEPVLVIAALAALVSCFFCPPDAAYLGYFDLRTLALLYALMVVVAGLRQAGLFDWLAAALCARAGNVRALGLVLVGLSFFSSMLVTNDVALLTFVPFAVVVLGMAGQRRALARVVVLQAVAANLGSMLTPVGNPQNLYLYGHYGYSFGSFLGLTLPVWGLSLVLVLLLCLPLSRARLASAGAERAAPDKRGLLLHGALFLLCLAVVLRLLPWPVMLGIVALALLLLDRPLLLRADFGLLATFAAFFIFSGNLARMEAVAELLSRLMAGREYLVSLGASQIISNVPAALLLSRFTGAGDALVLGVDVGGLGTPIASLASLIALKLYARSEGARTGRFLLEFTAVNALLLVLLSAFCLLALL